MTEYPEYLEELLEFLRIPSISTLSEHRPDMQKAAEWVVEHIRKAGIEDVETHVVDGGHPLVYASRVDNPSNPTVLLYGHYDVQPVDPLEEWHSPPFEPDVRDGKIFARGASDDKGQFAAHLFALRELNRQWKDSWPVNIKIIVEGEEEAGGESIEAWAPENRDKLAADFVLISDTPFVNRDCPSIDYSLRGIAYAEIVVTGPARDLHSGLFGGAVLNPLSALAHILESLVDIDTGRIMVPGFYDDVIEITERDRSLAREVPFEDRAFLDHAGVGSGWGEQGFSLYERLTSRPALDINGISGGFQDEGAKTIIPGQASAKVSMRLVPRQDPEKILRLLSEYVKDIAPSQVNVDFRNVYAAEGVLVDPENPYLNAAREVMAEVFGKKPALTRCGASIPVATVFNAVLGMDVVLMGFGMPDDGLHSPNEKFEVDHFYKAIEAVKKLLEKVKDARNKGRTEG